MCTTTNQSDTKPNLNRSPTTEQDAIVSIEIQAVICLMYQEKFIRCNVVALFLQLSVVIVTLPIMLLYFAMHDKKIPFDTGACVYYCNCGLNKKNRRG